jgi:hypothetical protein
MALGAAACLAVMLAGRNWQAGRFPGNSDFDESDEIATGIDDDARTLAAVWTELWSMEDELSPVESDDDAVDSADSVLASASRDERESAPPDWLLAAVAGDDIEGGPPAAPQPN